MIYLRFSPNATGLDAVVAAMVGTRGLVAGDGGGFVNRRAGLLFVERVP